MAKSRIKAEPMFAQLGKMVALWNDLELQLRRLIILLSDDVVTALVLSADMQAAALMNAVETLAAERDIHYTKIEKLSKAVSDATGRPSLTFDRVAEHVAYLVRCADRLREWRNYYAHGIITPDPKGPFLLGGITARGGQLDSYDQEFSISDIRKVSGLIKRTVAYAEAIIKCVHARKTSPFAKPPTWPKKPPLPEKLKKPRTGLQDKLPLF